MIAAGLFRRFVSCSVGMAGLICGVALVAWAVEERPPAGDAARADDAERCFHRTRVIGYSQVGARQGGWFVAGGEFESIVGADHWELLWAGGAGVDRWRNPNYPGWSRPLVSRCPGDEPPDRVLLSISGPYGADEDAWAEAIEATIATIRQKIPSARQIVLQPVVGGPGGEPCPPPGARRRDGDDRERREGRRARDDRRDRGGRVRASWQHAHIVNAINAVVTQHEARAAEDAGENGVRIVAGYRPQVRTCDDYSDGLGHLTPAAARAAGRTIGTYYAEQDEACRREGHPRCGKGSRGED